MDEKKYSVKQMAIVALIVAVAAVLLWRAIFKSKDDGLDQRIRELNEQIDGFNQVRDSLNSVIAERDAMIDSLDFVGLRLQNQIEDLNVNIARSETNISTFRSRPTHVTLQPDSLLMELNAIVRDLPDNN